MISVAFDMRDPVRSGIARVARSMARAFVENDSRGEFECTLAGPLDQLQSLGADQWAGGRCRLIDWPVGRFSLAAEVHWRRISAATRGSIWYFPHWDMPWVAGPRGSVLLISDVIPLLVPGATTAARREIARRWIRHTGLRATRLAASTRFTRAEILGLWPDFSEKIDVMPLGVEPRFFGTVEPLPPEIAKLVATGPFMLSVGNRKPHKNLGMGPQVLARIPDLHWLVVGESFRGWEQVVALAATLGVTDRMHVLDPQPDAVVHGLYAASACLFFPSRNEGFGLPILEALASGTSVVVGDAGAPMEVLGGHGAVCPLDDPDAFAAAVRRAMTSGPPGPQAREYAASFSWQRSAGKLAEVVRAIAAS